MVYYPCRVEGISLPLFKRRIYFFVINYSSHYSLLLLVQDGHKQAKEVVDELLLDVHNAFRMVEVNCYRLAEEGADGDQDPIELMVLGIAGRRMHTTFCLAALSALANPILLHFRFLYIISLSS